LWEEADRNAIEIPPANVFTLAGGTFFRFLTQPKVDRIKRYFGRIQKR
jgi:hypothetical protein